MIGEIILQVRNFLDQTFCIHDYTIKNREVGMQIFTVYECKKCGKVKVKG